MYVQKVSYALLALSIILLPGCAARRGLNEVGSAASQPPPAAPPQAVSTGDTYALSARCNGPMVQFRLQNLSSSELLIEEKDFALVVPGQSRKVIPYSRQSVTVELPKNSVAPNEMIEGRAVFNENTAPSGCRLVFKPYSRPGDKGTFADINPGA